MKKTLIALLFAATIACKKNKEVAPCYTLQAEKVITYAYESPEFYKHSGQAHTIRSEFEYCLKTLSLEALLKGMMADSSYKINGICVTYTVAKKKKLK